MSDMKTNGLFAYVMLLQDYQKEFCSEIKAKLLKMGVLVKGCLITNHFKEKFTIRIHGVFCLKNFDIEFTEEPHNIKYNVDYFETNTDLKKILTNHISQSAL